MTLKYNYNSPIMNKYLNNRVSNYRLSRYGWSRGYNRGLGNFGLCGGVVRQQIIYSTPKQSKSAERIQNVAMICSAIGALGTSIAGIITACKAGGVQTSSNSVNDISKNVQNKVDSSGTTVDTSTYSTDNGAEIKAARDKAISESQKCNSAIKDAMKKCRNSHSDDVKSALETAITEAETQKSDNEDKIKEFEDKRKQAEQDTINLKKDQDEKIEKHKQEKEKLKELEKKRNEANRAFDAKKKKVQELKENIEKKGKELKKYTKGSKEYTELEKEINGLKSSFASEKVNLENLGKIFNNASNDYDAQKTTTKTAETEKEQAERAYSIGSSNNNSIISYADSGKLELERQNNILATSISNAKAELTDISIDEPEP